MNEHKPVVFIVDDKPQNLGVLYRFLTSLGIRIFSFQNPLRVEEQVAKRQPDLLILDVLMPELDGYQLCLRLKNNPTICHIPVIFMSALSETVNKVEGFRVGGVDYITKPFSQEEVYARINTQLKIRQQQKALEDLNSELLQKNHSLIGTDRQRTRLYSVIAHDLKNRLRGGDSLVLLAQKQLQANTQGKVAQTLTDLRQWSSKLSEFLTITLDWVRARAQAFETNLQVITLKRAILSAVSEIACQATSNKISIDYEIDENLQVYADQQLLHVILSNLLSNALKFTPDGGSINITTLLTGSQVQVNVCDTGPGFDELTLTGLFTPDQLESKPGARGETGTGLGLALCREFVQLNNGRIWAHNNPRGGAVLSFTLPLNKEN